MVHRYLNVGIGQNLFSGKYDLILMLITFFLFLIDFFYTKGKGTLKQILPRYLEIYNEHVLDCTSANILFLLA